MTPEEWTNQVEYAVNLYWESNYDQILLDGLQKIQDSKEFAENLSQYTTQDPTGVERWEKLLRLMTEIEEQREEALSDDPLMTQEG
jgi:hypothetical protein